MSLPRERLTLWNRSLSCSVQPAPWGKSACVQRHDEITPAWLLNLSCGVPSEAACARGSQLSGLLPQTGILSTWQTSTSGVTLKSHAAIKKKSLFLILSLLRLLQKWVTEATDLTFGRRRKALLWRLEHRFKSSAGLLGVEVGHERGEMEMWIVCTAERGRERKSEGERWTEAAFEARAWKKLLQSGEFLTNICFSFQQWRPLIPDAQNKQRGHQLQKNSPWHHPETCAVAALALWDVFFVPFFFVWKHTPGLPQGLNHLQFSWTSINISSFQHVTLKKGVKRHLILN